MTISKPVSRRIADPRTGIVTPEWGHALLGVVSGSSANVISSDQFTSIESFLEFDTTATKRIVSGTHSFSRAISVPANSTIEMFPGSALQPNFEPTGTGRNTPLVTFGDGTKASYFAIHLPSGIDTIKTCLRVGSNCQIGHFKATSYSLNNNRTAAGTADLDSGAIVISGDHIRIGLIELDNFDAGWTVIDSWDVVIEKVYNTNTCRGGYSHGTRDLHVMAAHTEGATNAAANAMTEKPRGIMTPGVNSLLLGGCSDSSFGLGGGWWSYDILEHAIRVGAQQAGTSVPNQRLAFGSVKSFRPYGCGFKCDDADAFSIKRITVESIYTEDVGVGNWFGTAGYQNWSKTSGGLYYNDASDDNDGNKVACAIRNSQYVQIGTFQNRPNAQTESGYMGFWVERANNVTAHVDTESARTTGVCVQSGGSTSPDNILITGRTSNNLGAGVLFDASPSTATWRGVVADIDSQGNGTYDFQVTESSGSTSPYATRTSRIAGFARGGTSGNVDVAPVVLSDADFVDEVRATGTWTPSFTFATPGDVSLASVSASGIWRRTGREIYIEGDYSATVTHTTASGNMRITGLPFAPMSSIANINIYAIGSLVAPGISSRLVPGCLQRLRR